MLHTYADQSDDDGHHDHDNDNHNNKDDGFLLVSFFFFQQLIVNNAISFFGERGQAAIVDAAHRFEALFKKLASDNRASIQAAEEEIKKLAS